MKKYLVRFTTSSGEYDKEWTYAHSEEEAARIIQDDHWNIERIDLVEEL